MKVELSDGFKSALVVIFLSVALIFSPRNLDVKPQESAIPEMPKDLYFTCVEAATDEAEPEPDPEPTPEVVPEPEFKGVSQKEIELLALLTMAEAEGECEEGKRLVIDTVLNRVDSKHFPNTITEVIYQKNQFTSMWNGRVDRCYVREDICQLVREELVSRTNKDVAFFTAGNYGKYGTPMFPVGNHYFSRY